jgi:hypothetical protein
VRGGLAHGNFLYQKASRHYFHFDLNGKTARRDLANIDLMERRGVLDRRVYSGEVSLMPLSTECASGAILSISLNGKGVTAWP